jgi:hypothetical protein
LFTDLDIVDIGQFHFPGCCHQAGDGGADAIDRGNDNNDE